MRAWLTPENIPAQHACVALEFPDSEAWRAIVEGALLNLADESNWELFGAVTAEEAAAEGFRIYESVASCMGGCVPIGGIIPFGSYSVPDGWLLCNGQLVSPDDYPELHAAIYTTFGTEGGNFRVPDLRGAFPRGTPGTEIGGTGGAATHTLTVAELPSHAHASHYHAGLLLGGEIPATAVGTTTQFEGQYTGGGEAHNNLPPYVNIFYIIRAK